MASIPTKCSISDCNKRNHARGFCASHYYRWYKYGDPLKGYYYNHGESDTLTYNSLERMKTRIFNPNDAAYSLYGARGIKACRKLCNYKGFKVVLGQRPGPEYSLDRIDTTGHYSCGACDECITNGWPLNCRWATAYQQAWNKSLYATNTTGFIGVTYRKNIKKWIAQIGYGGRLGKNTHYLGCFDDPEQAALEYDKAVIFWRGHDGVTNFL